MRSPPSARRAERGAAAVEFALVLPVLVLVCLGAIEWGFHFYEREIVVNAAREGARAGSIAEGDPGTAAHDRSSAYLTVAGIDPGACTVTPDSTDATSIKVTVSCPGGSFTLLFEPFMPSQIVATAEMRREPSLPPAP